MTQSIEEAWGDAEQWFMEGQDDLRDTTRNLALAVLEEAHRPGGDRLEHRADLRRRIEELGR